MQLTLPALILTCSLSPHTGVNDTLYRIILTHSRGQPLYIQNPHTGTTYQPTNVKQAALMTKALMGANHTIRIGLAGINPRHLHSWRLSHQQGFSVCTHIKLASVLLEASMKKHKVLRANNTSRLLKALAHYDNPKNPKDMTTQDWAFMIMAMPKVSVKKDFKHPKPGPTYLVKRSMKVLGQTSPKPTKWKSPPVQLKAQDQAPHQKGGPLAPVTDRRL